MLKSLYYLSPMKMLNNVYPATGKIRSKIVARFPFLSSTAEKKNVHVYQKRGCARANRVYSSRNPVTKLAKVFTIDQKRIPNIINVITSFKYYAVQ